MTASFFLEAKEGESLTEAYDALMLGFPDVYEQIEDLISSDGPKGVLGGSGNPHLSRIQIDLKHLPPEAAKELVPIFALVKAIVEKYLSNKVVGKVVITEDNDITVLYL